MVKKLPYKTFVKTFKLVPRVAVDLLVSNLKGEILLTKRSTSPFENFWHIPGGFLLKEETITIGLERVAKDELGINIKGNKANFLGVFEDIDKDPRGHVIDIIYGCRLKTLVILNPGEDTKEIRFFKNLPPNVGFNHKETLLKLGYK